MNSKKILWAILIFSVPVFILGLVPLSPESFGLCKNSSDFDCLKSFDQYRYFGYLIILAPLVFISCAVLLLRIKSNEIFQAWKKFVKWYLGIVAGIFLLFAFSDGGGGNFGVGDALGDIFLMILLFVLFIIISAGIIIAKSRKLRGK